MTDEEVINLFRPTGPKELALVAESSMRNCGFWLINSMRVASTLNCDRG